MRFKKTLYTGMALTVLAGCTDLNVPNFNDPSIEDLTGNPTATSVISAAQNLMNIARGNTSGSVMYFGVWGREAYDLRPEEPRTTTDRLIGPLDPVNGGAFWGGEYTDIKNVQVLLDALDVVEGMSDQEKEAIRGFAKTVAAEAFWTIIVAHTTFGAASDPADDPGQELAPIVSEGEIYTRIFQLLDEGQAHLQAGGSAFPFTLTSGYAGFNTPGTFIQLNRALKARYHKYRGEWQAASDALAASFVDAGAPLDLGVHHNYSTNPGDAANPFFSVASHYAHPRYRADAQLKGDGTLDDRALSNTVVQGDVFSLLGIDVTEKYSVYPAQDSPLPWILNDELILLRAESQLGLGNRGPAIADVNVVRQAYGLDPFVDPGNDNDVLTEILYNKFMSLTLRGGYTYFDARQYDRLDQLPRARADHRVFPQLPFPRNECLARDNLGTGDGEPCGTIFGS